MTKKAKVLIFFLLIFLALILYLILTSESVKKIDNSNLTTRQAGQPAENRIIALSEEDYKIEFKKIFTAYEKLAENNSFTPEKVGELKNQTLNLKSPTKKFIMAHTNLFIALNQLEDYLKQKNQPGKNESQKIINQLKIDYGWLSN